MREELLRELERRMRVRQIPGVSLRIAQGATKLFSCDLGVGDLTGAVLEPRHRFRIGSLSKPLVAHAVLRLAGQRELDLEQSICRYVPEIESQPALRRITLAHLLSHRSGLARGPYHARSPAEEHELDRIGRSELSFSPGEDWKYSNWGYYLLGKVIERVSGCPPEAFIEQEVFAPLGMTHSGFLDRGEVGGSDLATGYWKGRTFGSSDLSEPLEPCPSVWLPACAAGVVSTADDCLRWLIGMRGGGEGIAPIEPGVAKAMLATREKIGRNLFTCYGLFAELVDELPFFFVSGIQSGSSGFLFLIPDLDLVGVALSNGCACNDELRDMLYRVAREVAGPDRLPQFGRREERFDVIAGTKSGETIRVRSGAEGPVLIAEGRQTRLYPQSERAYFLIDGPGRSPMLRIRKLGAGDAIFTLGAQVFYEKLRRLRRTAADAERDTERIGSYVYPPFGDVEVLAREGELFLDYGALCEVALRQIGEDRFEQLSGPFRREIVQFRRDAATGAVDAFLLNEMVFLRRIEGSGSGGRAEEARRPQ